MAGFYQKLLIRLPRVGLGALERENEELRAQAAGLEARTDRDRLQRENEALRARIAELEAQAARR